MHSHIQYRTGRTELAPTNLDVWKMLQWSGPAPPLSHRRRLVTNRGHAAHHMTLKSLHSHNIHVTPHFFLLARTTWVICLVRKTRERREVKGKMIGNCNIAIEKVSYLDLKYSYRKTWRGCLDHCCCHPPRQHSCGCSMKKKPHQLERNFLSNSLNDCILPIT